MTVSRFTLLFLAALAGVLLLASSVSVSATAAPEPLPRLPNLDGKSVSVSGLSSGAFMAVQFQVAYSSGVKGAGVIAGGPYYCAMGSLDRAKGACMSKYRCDEINVDELVKHTADLESKGKIDAIKNLQAHQVYLFSGKRDTLVDQCVMKALVSQYQSLGVPAKNALSRFDMNAEHAMITDKYGSDCEHLGSPYINNCKYSAAADLLQWIAQPGKPLKPAADIVRANLHEFGQANYTKVTPHTVSMDEIGYVYIPTSCKDGKTPCRLHIVFHGCDQYRAKIGTEYVEKSGYLEVAEANNFVLLFPQTVSSWFAPQNILGCWDWWGYTDSLYATKDGPQMKAIAAMVSQLTGA